MAAPAFIQNFIDGPKLPKIVLGVVGAVAIAGASTFLLLMPLNERVKAQEAKKQQLATDIATVRAQVAELQRFRKELAELQAKLELLKVKLPTEKETPALYKSLSEAAQGAGLGVSLFQPRDARPRDYVAEIPITITAEGGYHQLGQFFEKVAGLPRVVKVGEMKITSLPKSRNALRADMTLATYMYRDVAPAPKPGAAPAPAAPKPAAAIKSKEVRS
jgi:type IV pilus assembly protein PilO